MKSLTFFFLVLVIDCFSQSSWAGQYEGTLDGDRVVLTLVSAGGQQLNGQMKDSGNTYVVSGKANGSSFNGSAIEPNLGLNFEMNGTLSGNTISAILALDVFGTIQKMEIMFTKIGTSANDKKNDKSPSKNPVANKSRDQAVIGLWVKESNYSSGYSSNNSYGSMSATESMYFLDDGQMANGQSRTVISGSQYSGSASSNQVEVIPGLFWYTANKIIYLFITENGKEQTLELGKYYIENNHMLITSSNGEKLLLTKR